MNIEAVFYGYSKLMYGQLFKEDIYIWADFVLDEDIAKELADKKVFTFYDKDRTSIMWMDLLPASRFKESDLTHFIYFKDVPQFLYDNYGVILDEKQALIFKRL